MAVISKRSGDAMRPGAKDAYLWDAELAAFGLKVTPAGRKVYLVQYRLGGRARRTRRVTIGTHGAVTADEARREAKRVLGQVSAGCDPAALRDEARAAQTVGSYLERFLDEHTDAKLKGSTTTEYRRVSNLYVLPALRHRAIKDVTDAEMVADAAFEQRAAQLIERVFRRTGERISWT